ncbi:hypothetical protein OV450_5904 [Actinobacteria bacterium OV450]|nr:hypothetical protein OV450_5904 [Actinobacteria bacterium OV450]
MHQRTKGAGGDPLRRDADRARTRLRAAFALTCLLAVVVGFALGRAAWTDGHRTAENAARHRHTVHIVLNAVGIGTGALAGIMLVGGALVAVRLRVVDAHSARAWESEWAGVEPLWSGRLRPGQGAGDD